ncbi:MAG: hypothetical protein LUQ17_01320 [Methanomicrobiales archaeon]|nr:hypothetical protein [Methanomicrobiales archaeon]
MTHISGVLTTRHTDPSCVAGSVQPDNTQSMDTRAEGDRVITRFETESIRTMIASVDDYLMNLGIAEEMCRCASR